MTFKKGSVIILKKIYSQHTKAQRNLTRGICLSKDEGATTGPNTFCNPGEKAAGKSDKNGVF